MPWYSLASGAPWWQPHHGYDLARDGYPALTLTEAEAARTAWALRHLIGGIRTGLRIPARTPATIGGPT